MSLSPQAFVARWRFSQLKERAAAQSHFNDLCALVGHPTPAEDDPTGTRFTFEAGADKLGGGQGWADVWKKGYFAWEYKGKHANLDKAYQQLLRYRESLQNPPLLIVSDLDRMVVHTNFTNTVKQVIEIGLDDLLTPQGMRHLKDIFFAPEHFKSPQTTEAVTRQAAQEFARLADRLREQHGDSQQVAHFLIRLLFCLFSEDIGLLPDHLFAKMVERTRTTPDAFTGLLRQLFASMATGGWFGMERIYHFDGGLFDNEDALAVDREGMEILARVCRLDWSSIEPSILGTLFERSLDPSKRSQLGAHYTSRDDIMLIVEPVLMTPLRRRWQAVQTTARDLAEKRDNAGSRAASTRYANELERTLRDFADELAAVRVLDPACGSANFLYVSLRQLLDLWKEVAIFGAEMGLTMMSPLAGAPSPAQLYGIEVNPYAHELAQATIWIGWIQWLHENGYGTPSEPILKPLDTIKNMDAVLAFDAAGNPVEPQWPDADVIVGNPPFLGDKKMRAELGHAYVDSLRHLYIDRIAGGSDFVTYWFERAREFLSTGKVRRVGLLATNSIRRGSNRDVLDKIKGTGDIFMGWSDRPWILDGAAVRVSIIGFDDGTEQHRILDGEPVSHIYSDLTSEVDVTVAIALEENENLCFLGMMKAGPFDIEEDLALRMLSASGNPNGRPNSDVVKPRIGGIDIVQNHRHTWIIDFGVDMTEADAALYEAPFEYVKAHVKPIRESNRRKRLQEQWWIHGEPRRNLRQALENLTRFIATPEVAKHRIFTWVSTGIIPDQTLHNIVRDDDYFFGVLHSRIHEVWALAQGNRMGVGNDPRYNSSRTFSTFPFPWPPGTEPTDDPRVGAIAQAAQALVEKRDAWLNPPGLSEKELTKRTLTNLYNAMPTWLALAHQQLDAAVFAAYGWPPDLSDDEILARLLALNWERAGR